MKGKISFSWSPALKRYDVSVPGERIGTVTLASWLSNDLQTNIEGIREWTNWINEVAAGQRQGGYLGTGNAHSVMAVGQHVYIESEHVEYQKVFLSHDQIVELLKKYSEFVTGEMDDPDNPPKPVEVEYLAEGEDAANLYAETGGSWGLAPEETA